MGCGNETSKQVSNQKPKTECIVKTTPVKNQGQSEFCWIYAMLATIESEHLMMGDSVNLSADFVARNVIEERVKRYFLEQGEGNLNMRGTCSELLDVINNSGITHYDSFHSDANYKTLVRKLKRMAEISLHERKGMEKLMKNMGDLLDSEVHAKLKYVFLLGAEYTPQEFAHSVCRKDEYIALTSFTHHPFNEPFALEIPDNHGYQFMNLPIDTLVNRIDEALKKGHPVCWEGDTSEPLFSFKQGIAKLEKDSIKVTQAYRQQLFETFETTDDHCMELIGIAKTPKGKKYYICKNSWGTENAFEGFMYMSENYLRAKTLAVWMSTSKENLFEY